MKRIEPFRRGDDIAVEEKLNEIIEAINAAGAITVGPGLEMKQGRFGTVISLAPSMREPRQGGGGIQLFYQNTEPAAAVWRAGGIWICTAIETGGHYVTFLKTKDDPESNASKIRWPNIIVQYDEPAASAWGQGDIWIDADSLYQGKYCQAWIKTAHSNENNDSKVPLTILV